MYPPELSEAEVGYPATPSSRSDQVGQPVRFHQLHQLTLSIVHLG
jgi:hypothetical protein